jgi:hypothetical protein
MPDSCRQENKVEVRVLFFGDCATLVTPPRLPRISPRCDHKNTTPISHFFQKPLKKPSKNPQKHRLTIA